MDYLRLRDEAERHEREAEAIRAHDRLRRFQAVKPAYKKEDGGWCFSFGLPGFDGERGKRIRRSGFRTKVLAQRAANEVLAPLEEALRSSLGAYRKAIADQQAKDTANYLKREAALEAANTAAAASVAVARREKERGRRVYYVRRLGDGAIKIGTTWNLDVRMAAFRNVSPVELLAHHSGGQPAEAALHRRFANLRLDGEWFSAGADLLAHIRHVQDRMVQEFRDAG